MKDGNKRRSRTRRGHSMLRLTKVLVILFASWALTACSSLTVRAPTCEPPPLPVGQPTDCADLEAITDPSFGALYQQSIRDAAQYQECRNNLRNYVVLVKYRDSVCPHIQSQLQSTKSWYEFWK
jgi:hypothetical protein